MALAVQLPAFLTNENNHFAKMKNLIKILTNLYVLSRETLKELIIRISKQWFSEGNTQAANILELLNKFENEELNCSR